MQNDLQEQSLAQAGVTDVTLEFGDGLWFVAVRREVPVNASTHERQMPGYLSHEEAAEAALHYAAEHGLTVDSREQMIEEAVDALRFFENDQGFEV